MTEEVAALQIRLEATTAKLERALRRGEQKLNSTARNMEARAGRLDNRLSTIGSRFGGRAFQRGVQQAGFQIGDFAVQVAGGTSAITAMTQQGSQLLGAFGVWGSVLGAAGAVVGALATSLLDAGDAADGTAADMSTLSGAMEVLEQSGSRVDDLNAQIANSSGIVRDALVRERDATVELLKARLALAKETLADRRRNLREEAAIDARFSAGGARGQVQRRRDELAGPGGSAIIDAEQARILAENPDRAVNILGLERQIAQTEAGLTRLSSGGGASGSPVFSVGSRRSRGGRSGSSRDQFGDSAERIRERIIELRNEREQIGLNEEATTRLRAAFEREKLERELVNAAQKDGTAATPEEIALAEELASEVEMLTIAIYDEKEAIEAASKAKKQAKKDQEDLAKSINATANKFIQAVESAEDFEDALKKIGLQLLELAANAVIGQGPLGGAFDDLIGSSGNGILGLFDGGSSAGSSILSSSSAASALPAGFAKGGAFSGGRVIPFANGGVVSSPTAFPMVNGTGLMGEAGPEAIMPLSRGPGGKLGVQASIGASPVVVNINNTSGAEITAQQNGPNLDIMVEQAVARSISQGGRVNKAIRQSFQLGQPATRRG